MADLNDNNEFKVIAFYLPQFHSIPENDEAYGKGFTEWTNVKKAMPLFEGHYQPRTPMNGNYYSLLEKGVMKEQSNTAQDYGIYGFCYYHYWFKNGKKLLEKPIENMLYEKDITIPFCLCWANENWSKRWDGGNNEVIVEQDYGGELDWDLHLQYLLHFFRDDRYIKIDGKPMFIVYKPEIIPKYLTWVRYMRKRILDYGFKGIVIIAQHPNYILKGYSRRVFDYFIEFEPSYTRIEEKIKNVNRIKLKLSRTANDFGLSNILKTIIKSKCNANIANKCQELTIRDYDLDWIRNIERDPICPKMIKGAFVDWDNTPRNKRGIIYRGSTPDKFYSYFLKLINKTKCTYMKKVIFVNAWNEWAEGAYLEPDEKYGYAYLQSLKKALDDCCE